MYCYFTTKLYYEYNLFIINLGNDDKYKNLNLRIQIINKEEPWGNATIDNCVSILYDNSFIFEDTYFWHNLEKPIQEYALLTVNIFHDGELIFTDIHRIKDKTKVLIPRQAVFIHNIGGMGDYFSAEPTLRKISESYNQKVRLYTHYPDLFKNHPCVDTMIQLTTFHAYDDYHNNISEEDRNEYEINYTLLYDKTYTGKVPNWAAIDYKQLCAGQCGFHLKPDELDFNFYPDKFRPIEGLPEKYVCINPNKNGTNNWNMSNWQDLVDDLNENGIFVVAIGKTMSNGKTFNNLRINYGLDLAGKECQNDLSQAWHIINNSQMFITPDSGLFIFAGSTDAHILLIGSNWDPYFHIPYRKGRQDYKFSHVSGKCPHQNCISELKYAAENAGDINRTIGFCHLYLDKDKLLCHPTYKQVSDEVLKILKNVN